MFNKIKKIITCIEKKNLDMNKIIAMHVAGCKEEEDCNCKVVGKVEDKFGRIGPDKIITTTVVCVKKAANPNYCKLQNGIEL